MGKQFRISNYIWLILLIGIFPLHIFGEIVNAPSDATDYSFEVKMQNPNTHYYQVEFTCTNQHSDYIDFKMPVWTPGYYAIQNNSKNVVGFYASNSKEKALPFYKTSKNTWRVSTKGENTVQISYDVYAFDLSVVSSYLDVFKGFISPTDIFMFPDGHINDPVKVKIDLYQNWHSISTGLDKISDSEHTFYAGNFDVLFDCPILLGNQKEIEFEVKGIPHALAFSAKDTLDKTVFINDLTKIIETATDLMGDIPYTHYTFITIGSPGGGLEHSNSCALSCTGSVADTTDMKGYKRWLSFVTHEYFHLFNVKRIRPIALGPFDYDRENYTNLLWLSEGGTVYYEYIILNRAGLFSREDCYNGFSESILGYYNRPGHLVQSVGLSSFDAWIHYFDPSGDEQNNAISYYDKGCAVSLILDLKIRQLSNNTKSLDDAMRGLYNKYYKELKRGFTDDEMKQMCESVAGAPLNDVFNTIESVTPINYPKYFAIAGLSIDTSDVKSGKPFFGAQVRATGKKVEVNQVQRNSPAWNSGLGNHLILVEIDSLKATTAVFDSIMALKQPGNALMLKLEVDKEPFDAKVILGEESHKTFKIKDMDNSTELQKTILNSWLKSEDQ